MNIISLDLEFSGLNRYFDRIIEIGAVKFSDDNMDFCNAKNNISISSFDSIICPSVSVPERITELTGITESMLQAGVSEEQALKDMLDFFDGNNILLGHNVCCDYEFLKSALDRYNMPSVFLGIDTLKISRICHPELEKKTLEYLCSYYEITPEKIHRANSDALCTAILYMKLKENFYSKYPDAFKPFPLIFKEKKKEPAMKKQIKLLKELVEQYGITVNFDYDNMTKSEASHHIDIIKSGAFLKIRT